MDADGLPIVGDGIDFTKVGAIHQKRTLAFLNHFITHTVRFLNRFSGVCEEKLEDLTGRLQRIETTMNILEAKLNSVAGLENVTVARNTNTSQPATSTLPDSSGAASQVPATTPEVVQEEQPAEPEKPPGLTISQDPRFKKYFTLLNMNVNILAVQQKMRMEGVDPELILNPDAPAPSSNEENSGTDSDEDSEDYAFDD